MIPVTWEAKEDGLLCEGGPAGKLDPSWKIKKPKEGFLYQTVQKLSCNCEALSSKLKIMNKSDKTTKITVRQYNTDHSIILLLSLTSLASINKAHWVSDLCNKFVETQSVVFAKGQNCFTTAVPINISVLFKEGYGLKHFLLIVLNHFKQLKSLCTIRLFSWQHAYFINCYFKILVVLVTFQFNNINRQTDFF
jgi:hypothetical protein